MASVVIYTKQGCRHSERARDLLDERGIQYREIDVTGDLDLKEEMVELSGGRSTTPQIIIDGEPLGGADDLEDADRAGRLAALLVADHQPSA